MSAAAAASTASPLDELALALGFSAANLQKVPRELLGDAMDELKYTIKRKMAVYAALPDATGATPEQTLAKHFAEQERRAREPWRAVEQRLAVEREALQATPPDELRAFFLDMARTQTLEPEDVLTGTYLLYGEEADRRFLAGLLQKKPRERVQAHNFFVASMMPPQFLAAYGEHLLTLRYPLFPHTKEFSALNVRLLQETTAPTGGAAAATAERPSVYRRRDEAAGGEYLAPVQQHPSGAHVVDLTMVESAVVALQARCNALEQQLKTQSGRGGRGGRGGNSGNNGAYGAQRGNGGGRGHNAGNFGRRGGRDARGGDADEANFA